MDVPAAPRAIDPTAERRFAHGAGYAQDGDQAAAADLFAQAIERDPSFLAAWFALGRSRVALGETHAAIAAFEHVIEHDPADAMGAGLELARLGARAPDAAISPAFVAALFDQYADRFDTHLVQALAYRGPQIVLDAVDAVAGADRRFDSVLDLGCGTGLFGTLIRPRAAQLSGIDLSAGMIDRATAKHAGLTPLYDALDVAEIANFLEAERRPYDLIAAVDVFVYCGNLAPILAACARALAPDGLIAFTVQTGAERGYALGTDSRFTHDEAHIRDTAASAGLAVALLVPASTRRDAGADVPGLVVVLRTATPSASSAP